MYNKLFTKILDSSIWLEPDATRIVWLTLIAAMDEDGFVQFASVANLAHRARVSITAAKRAIAALEDPDENSSDPENEGRRIERVAGGWIILNSQKYRELVSRAISREKTRLRVAKCREAKKACNAGVTPANASVTPSEAGTEARAEEEPTTQKNTPPARKGAPTPTDDDWIAGLEKKDCYKPISIRSELGKAQTWCETHSRKCTRRFFANWLNRALESAHSISTNGSRSPNAGPIEGVWSLEKRIAAARNEIALIKKNHRNFVNDPMQEFPPLKPEFEEQVNTLLTNIDLWQKQITSA